MTASTVHRVVGRDGEEQVFAGRVLAHASTADRPRNGRRWIELTLYRKDGGELVLQGVGRSLEPGEVDRPWTYTSRDPAAIARRLRLRSGDGTTYLPIVSRRLLLDACDACPSLAERLRPHAV